MVYTDEHLGDKDLAMKHKALSHSAGGGVYQRQNASTNGIKSFWAVLQRAWMGHPSLVKLAAHAHRYLAEHEDRHDNTGLCWRQEVYGCCDKKCNNK